MSDARIADTDGSSTVAIATSDVPMPSTNFSGWCSATTCRMFAQISSVPNNSDCVGHAIRPITMKFATDITKEVNRIGASRSGGEL
eukprot:SAG11_NODE_4014_length_2107_cov_1.057769_1_plen_86_part_00